MIRNVMIVVAAVSAILSCGAQEKGSEILQRLLSGKSEKNPEKLLEGANSTGTQMNEPTLAFDGITAGCSDLAVYRENAAYTEIIVVEADRRALNLSTSEVTFLVQDAPDGLNVYFEQHRAGVDDIQRFQICDDQVIPDAPIPKHWNASSGRVTIKISSDAPQPGANEYQVTVRLENVVLDDPEGGPAKTVEQLELRDVAVGMFPG